MSSVTRREFCIQGAGYALAVSPVTAWAITTPTDGIDAGPTIIHVGSDKMPAYFAHPKGGKAAPCVLVIQEIFGLHEYIQDVCRRFAAAGYYAVAPSLYFRQGDATKIADIKQLIAEIVSKVPAAQVMSDLDATAAWLAQQKGADANRMAITGFCWGGNVTWMYSAHNPKLKAGVAWYGKVDGAATPLQPKFPVDIAADLKVPVLGLYGGKDSGISQESLEKMRAALKKGHSRSEIIVFPNSEHGFHADYRPSYNEKDAKEGWGKLLAWFKAHGA